MCRWKLDIWFCLSSYRSELAIESTHNCGMFNSSVAKLKWVRYRSCNVFDWNQIFDSFRSTFNILLASFNISLFTFFHWYRREGGFMVYIFHETQSLLVGALPWWIFEGMLLREIDFWIQQVNQAFVLILILYLLTL